MKKFRRFEYKVSTESRISDEVTVYLNNHKVATIADFEVNEEEDITTEDENHFAR